MPIRASLSSLSPYPSLPPSLSLSLSLSWRDEYDTERRQLLRPFCILSLTLVVVDDVAKGQCSGASDVTIHSCGETR